jgi:predicted Ser/Thr protein kinase
VAGASAVGLAVLLVQDQRQRWRRGERLTVENYLARYAALRADPEAVLALILNEYLLREEHDETPDLQQFQQPFPQHADDLRRHIELRRELHEEMGRALAESGPPSAAEVATFAPNHNPSMPPTGAPTTQPAPQELPSPAGRVAVAGYEVLGVLGKGGMGIVYKARQLGLDREVALKMILHAEHAGEEERQRFRTEALAVARLHHPNIVQVHEVGECQGLEYFSMEYCPGGNLADKMDGKPWEPKRAARLVETLARAVHAAHRAQVVHRDLKPANVLIGADGRLKITDFGLAKRLDAEGGPTRSNVIMGTPEYMAPEQAAGKSRDIGPGADIYALGAMLYELLTCRPPFWGPTPLDTVLRVVFDDPVPPRKNWPRTPRDLEAICIKCLQKKPQDRYRSCQALADDLGCYLEGEPVGIYRPSLLSEEVLQWTRRQPILAAGAAFFSMVGCAFLLSFSPVVGGFFLSCGALCGLSWVLAVGRPAVSGLSLLGIVAIPAVLFIVHADDRFREQRYEFLLVLIFLPATYYILATRGLLHYYRGEFLPTLGACLLGSLFGFALGSMTGALLGWFGMVLGEAIVGGKPHVSTYLPILWVIILGFFIIGTLVGGAYKLKRRSRR